MDYNKKALALHKKYQGKIGIKVKVPLKSAADLATAYTPGVAAVCLAIKADKKRSWDLTNRANQIAIVTDGTAILGLGNIGSEAGMPVMEGKAAIFKQFADVDAFPLCINTTNTEEIIKFCKALEPSLGGINLEDISAPRCFEILERLENEISIPVFHDDQDGTAIVVLAALINACRVTKKVMKRLRIVINGSGAAGIAIARLLIAEGVSDIILVDSVGAVFAGRKDMNRYKKEIAAQTNRRKLQGGLEAVLVGADVFIGVSMAGLLSVKMIETMNKNAIIFAMANPIPEIMPDLAVKAGAAIVGTGRSDFPNQINNALVFPGMFRGLLDGKINKVSQIMKLSAAKSLANTIKNPHKYKILPNITDKIAVTAIAQTIRKFKVDKK
jgi:malate dehydrogenase (oxaloacetate-decarboxylating)